MAFQEVKGQLGFGLMRLPKIGDEVDLEKTIEMVDYFIESGYTYFDTAYNYIDGKSEKIVKEALVNRYPRESFQLATKLPAWEIKGDINNVKKLFETSMERTGAGYLDYYLLHAVSADNNKIYTDNKMWEFVKELKEKGLVKNFGFSYHDSAENLEPILAAHSDVDFIQLQINYLDWENESIEGRKCYEIARKYNIPVIVMEPVKGGLLADLPSNAEKVLKELSASDSMSSWAFKYCANIEGVKMILSGMNTMDQVKDNVATFNSIKPLTEAEIKALDTVTEIINSSENVPCTNCKYCVEDCPQNIDIPGIFGRYNMFLKFGDKKEVRDGYNFTTKDGGIAGDCISCGACEGHCPQHINIIDKLSDVSAVFDTAN